MRCKWQWEDYMRDDIHWGRTWLSGLYIGSEWLAFSFIVSIFELVSLSPRVFMIRMASSKQDDSYASHVHKEHLLGEDDIESRSSNAMPEILRQLTPKEYKKVGDKATLKMDIIIVPCLMLMYILNYLDRNNIASAKLANISEDLDLTPTEYQSCISILFVGYSECFMLPIISGQY